MTIKKTIFSYLFLLLISFAFFVATAHFNTVNQAGWPKFGSPDESANYFFSRQYAKTGSLSVFESDNLVGGDLVSPRSYRSDNGFLKPMSFIGLPIIYGTLANIFGLGILLYLTPFFAVLGIWFFYFFLKKAFNNQVALIASFVLAIFPVYFHYASRGFFHNILFISLFLGSLMFLPYLKTRSLWPNIWKLFLSGIFLGLAISVRTSELLWILPAFFLAWFFYFKRLSWWGPIVFLTALFLAWSPALWQNSLLYGAPFKGGYVEMNSTIENLKQGGSLEKIFNMIFYFGWHPQQAFNLFVEYFVKMFASLALLASFGALVYLTKFWQMKRREWLIFLAWIGLSGILLLYYGSWTFFDNPDHSRYTIGNSYTRYWLPVYLGAIILLATFVDWAAMVIAKFYKKKYLSKAFIILISGALSFVFIGYSLYGSEESLIYLAGSRLNDKAILSSVVEITEPDAIIITRYHDKVFFPERKVIVGLFDDERMIAYYSALSVFRPMYYFNFKFSDEDLKYLNQGKLKEYNLEIELVKTFPNRFALYRLKKI